MGFVLCPVTSILSRRLYIKRLSSGFLEFNETRARLSVSVSLRGLNVTRKHERARRGTATDVT